MGDALPPAAFPPPGAEGGPGRAADVPSAGGRSFRALSVRGGPGVIQVALDRTREEELLAGYRRSLWLVLLLALVACAVGGYQIARRGLRPLREIAATAGRIRPTPPAEERLPAAGPAGGVAAL